MVGRGQLVIFQDGALRYLLGFKPTVIYEKHILSDTTDDIIPFDIIFPELYILQGMLLKGKRSGIVHNFTEPVDPGFIYTWDCRGGIQWYTIDTKDFFFNHQF